jgi:hypothetical protein
MTCRLCSEPATREIGQADMHYCEEHFNAVADEIDRLNKVVRMKTRAERRDESRKLNKVRRLW